MSVSIQQGPILYEADASVMQAVHQCRERIGHICRQHMNRRVRVRTASGQTVEGVIVGVDELFLYLDTSGMQPMMMRQPFAQPWPPYYAPYPPYYNPYSSAILPLALFDLLAIALIV